MGQNTLHFDALPDAALLSFQDVSMLTRWKRTKIFCDVRNGTFPAPLKIGRSSRWQVGTIRQYLQSIGAQAVASEQ